MAYRPGERRLNQPADELYLRLPRQDSPTTVTLTDVHPMLQALEPVADSLGGTIVPVSERIEGDVDLVWEGQVVGAFRAAGLQGALDRLIDQVERELGCPVTSLDRFGKQDVVRRLDELGAFTLRKAVEDIADRMQVSRFTIYNYLNSSMS